MSDTAPLLFTSDIKAFMEIVMNENADARFEALKANTDDVILCEIVRYGVFNDSAMAGPLADLYQQVVLQNYSEEQRWKLFLHIKGLVDHVEFVSANALLPFIVEDPLPEIVSTAVIDYVSVSPLTNGDAMSRPKDIVNFIKNGRLANIGAAFGGLLHLGDYRVCKLIWPLRDLLSPDDVKTATNCTTGFLYAATVEFEIDWLEEMDGEENDGLFGTLAAGLARQVRSSQMDLGFTGERDFPIPKGERTVAEQEEARERAKPISLEEFKSRIAPRLYALEQTEPPPRIMPLVLAAWGLKTTTDPSETVQLDDRSAPVEASSRTQEVTPSFDTLLEVREEWFDGNGQLFLSWGILNPNGPTLYCLGEREFDGERRYFFRWLHMLGGTTYYGRVLQSEQITYQDIFESAFDMARQLAAQGKKTLFEAIPSFVIPNDGDETIAKIAKDLISADAPDTKDWGREVAYARTFGDDHFQRAGCELRVTYEEMKSKTDLSDSNQEYLRFIEAAYGHIPAFKDAVQPQFSSSAYTLELFERWWLIVGATKHMTASIQTLVTMWRGAQSMLSDDIKAGSISIDAVIDFLEAYQFALPQEDSSD